MSDGTAGDQEETNEATGLSDGLSVGVWILMKYGFERYKFCVLERAGDKVLLGKPNWCVSSAMWFVIAELESKDGTILGRGKYRWWRKALPFVNDMIFPFSRHR